MSPTLSTQLGTELSDNLSPNLGAGGAGSSQREGQLSALEEHAIFVMREVAAECENPALLFSGGKDSVVMVHLAAKAFAPGTIPFPALQITTGHEFPEVLEFRDRFLAGHGMRLVIGSVQEAIDNGLIADPGEFASRNRLQSVALLEAIANNKFDAAFGGARRDEDKARAKERVLSFRDSFGQWDPRNQRPELWNLFNARIKKGEHLRAFPLSDWTELDIWRYIASEHIELPAMYYAHKREVFGRDNMLYAVGPWTPARAGETVSTQQVRYRTVGDMTCTGAISSSATNAHEVLTELYGSRLTERGATRADDKFSEAAMEDRKKEGYF
jgi:sulfate adenylyltransferase subunit 2